MLCFYGRIFSGKRISVGFELYSFFFLRAKFVGKNEGGEAEISGRPEFDTVVFSEKVEGECW